jgi:hypothetical protein
MPTRTPGASSPPSTVSEVAPNLAGESRQTVLRTNTTMTLARPSSTSLRACPTSAEVNKNPVALVYPVCAYVRVRPIPGQLPKVAELARKLPQVVECHRVTGEDCFIMNVYIPDWIISIKCWISFCIFGQTTTSIVQSSPVPPRGLSLPFDSATEL